MRQKSSTPNTPSERLVRSIRRATRKQYSAEEKIRIVLDGVPAQKSKTQSKRSVSCTTAISSWA